MAAPTSDPPDMAESGFPLTDPTALTTRMLQREIFGLRELLEVKLGASSASNDLIRTIIETRLDGMDKAIQLLQETANRFPARIDEKIESLRHVHEQKLAVITETNLEKFQSIGTQFRERDVRIEQSGKASETAVNAALQAAKEAVGAAQTSSALAISKSETATLKQIDQLGLLLQTGNKAIDDKIVDVKDRVTRIEGTGSGASAMGGYMVGGIGLLIGVAGLILAFLRMRAG